MIFQHIFKKNYSRYFVGCIFFIFLLIGLIIFEDYGLSNDEPFQRTVGYYWLINLLKKFSGNYDLINSIEQKFQLMYWSDYVDSGNLIQYGILFDTFAAFIEEFFNITNTHEAFYLKHFLTFLVFFISIIFFYKIILERFKNSFFSILIIIFYATSPRIFAEAFYNCKDIVFMSFTVIALYYALKSFDFFSYKNIFLFSIFSGFATNVRVMGLLLFLLYLLFFLFHSLEEKEYLKKNLTKFFFILISYPLIVLIFWPFLWEAPLANLVFTIKSFANFNMSFDILYMGNYYNITNLPWHYIPILILATTPVMFLVFFLIGFINRSILFFKNFLNLSNTNKLWKNINQKKDFFIIFFLLIPIFLVIFLNSTLYTGWRHLYFIYPCLIYFIAIGINFVLKYKAFNLYKKSILSLVSLILAINIFNIIKLHPYQNIYFNFLFEKKANQLFEIDYWGLGNKEALEFIKKNYENKSQINLKVASFSPVAYSDLILKKSILDKFNFIGTTEESLDLIFTNYIFDKNPIYEKKYLIPNNYDKIFSLKRGNITINEVFKRK